MKSIDKEVKAEEHDAMDVKTYRLPLDLIEKVKREAKRLKTSESAIVRAALRLQLEGK